MCYNIDEPGKHKKPDQKKSHILYDSVYITCSEQEGGGELFWAKAVSSCATDFYLQTDTRKRGMENHQAIKRTAAGPSGRGSLKVLVEGARGL